MPTEIKICGLKTQEAISVAIEAGADLAGFIFFEKSPRNISLQEASDLAAFANGNIKTVAVTVNATHEFLDQLVLQMHPDFLQLHGNESADEVLHIQDKYDLPVIKSLSVKGQDDLKKLESYNSKTTKFLLDAKAPKNSDLPGGNGVPFDWNILHNLDQDINYMLSGGLHNANILDALKISKAKSVDVSSGVEAAPGVKDIAKIKTFIKTIREYDNHVQYSSSSQRLVN